MPELHAHGESTPLTGSAPTARTGRARLVADVTTRLRPVCRGMSEERFRALVVKVVRFKLKWARGEQPRAD